MEWRVAWDTHISEVPLLCICLLLLSMPAYMCACLLFFMLCECLPMCLLPTIFYIYFPVCMPCHVYVFCTNCSMPASLPSYAYMSYISGEGGAGSWDSWLVRWFWTGGAPLCYADWFCHHPSDGHTRPSFPTIPFPTLPSPPHPYPPIPTYTHSPTPTPFITPTHTPPLPKGKRKEEKGL